MTNTLIKELSNADIDWLIAAGQQQQITTGTVLLQPREKPGALYLLLDGILSMNVPPNNHDCADTFPRSASQANQEITRLSRGEIIGETLLFNVQPLAAIVKAVENSTVLSIPQHKLAAKLQQDSHFSTHFYRSIALILSERLEQMLSMPDQLRAAMDQPIKEALFLFGELQDSDADWLVAVGRLEKLAPNTILIQAGRPIDALYLILDGSLSLSVYEGDMNPLTLCFDCPEKNAGSQKVIDRLSRGEMSGAISFLNLSLPPTTVRAIEESLVLAIPRAQLAMKLQQDMGFASRFYRVLAIQLSQTLQTAIGLLGCPQQTLHSHGEMDEDMEYDDELNLDSLHQVAQGAARFNWILKRLGVM
ncbi:MAG: cyclic nucleotide-binding domain-containing protein [Microcoleus sp. SIO2G3]|nr:cyclic nucleotide-binding domain-containing protein [Microcoleus sp. SIO2G3]